MWEYKILKLNVLDFIKSEAKIAEKLNEYGKDKWELVATFTHTSGGILGTGGGTYFATLLFKRPLI